MYKFIDLFSGGGGMSAGFHAHPDFEVIGAADAQLGKPSSPAGSLGCNRTYRLNIGISPIETDLGSASPSELREQFGLVQGELDVLSACPPCTGFSRTNAKNHLVDDARNSLVTRVALYAEAFLPRVIVMENARELLTGNFREHFETLEKALISLGYEVHSDVHFLNKFGLPQVRERALVVAARNGIKVKNLEDLWQGFRVKPEATTVRRAISHLPDLEAGAQDTSDVDHAAPAFGSKVVEERIRAVPNDGGSWRDLIAKRPDLLTPSMERSVEAGKLGSFPDVYGRMWWDRPAPTIKRECSHVGNGRYAHPEQDRLCSLREVALLNGFPESYQFAGSLSNRYRHVGDAVPPLISYQIAHLASWMLSGIRPPIEKIILPETSLKNGDILDAKEGDTGKNAA